MTASIRVMWANGATAVLGRWFCNGCQQGRRDVRLIRIGPFDASIEAYLCGECLGQLCSQAVALARHPLPPVTNRCGYGQHPPDCDCDGGGGGR